MRFFLCFLFCGDAGQLRRPGDQRREQIGVIVRDDVLQHAGHALESGAGLERMACVLQNVVSNYDTDLFTPLIARAAELTGVSAKKETEKESHSKNAASLRVIADHARASTFLISDGVLPANEGRGY